MSALANEHESGALPLALFDYALPPDRIAQEPARPRDASRLMVLGRRDGAVSHRRFTDLPVLLRPGDLLVVNRTRVIPARLRVTRPGGGQAELLFVRPLGEEMATARRWLALGRPARSLREGRALIAADGTELVVESRDGEAVVVRAEASLWAVLQRLGEVPLPPYIERTGAPRADDVADYQSVFARDPGAVAAPTASLHFTERVLAALRERGLGVAELVLHVGPGTFLPVRPEHAADVRCHTMHAEWYDIPASTREAVERARAAGARVVAVGTTAVRALETWAASGAATGESRLFLYPGLRFCVTDAMVTNFHQPRSTLLMLVAAFAGRERVLSAYAEAIRERYRFFSYGDAMLIA